MQEKLLLREQLWQSGAELQQQADFCSALGSATCSLLWSCSSSENAVAQWLADVTYLSVWIRLILMTVRIYSTCVHYDHVCMCSLTAGKAAVIPRCSCSDSGELCRLFGRRSKNSNRRPELPGASVCFSSGWNCNKWVHCLCITIHILHVHIYIYVLIVRNLQLKILLPSADIAAVPCGRNFLSSSAHDLLDTLMRLLEQMDSGVFPKLKVYVEKNTCRCLLVNSQNFLKDSLPSGYTVVTVQSIKY